MYKIFIDVDNTVLEHTGFYTAATESRIHKTMGKNPDDNKEAIKMMYKSAIISDPTNFKKLFFKENTYIITKSSNEVYETYKQVKLAELLGITIEELRNYKDENGLSKYIWIHNSLDKAKYIKEMFNIKNLSDYVLIDDYSNNLIKWEENKGIGIKYYNNYNSPHHPNGGLVISNFKIFDFLNVDSTKFVFSDDFLISKIKSIFQTDQVNYISTLQLIKDDILKTFDINENTLRSYKKLSPFIETYYEFIENCKMERITDKMKTQIDYSNLNIVDIPFNYDESKYKTIIENGKLLKIKYIEGKEENCEADAIINISKHELYTYKERKINRSLRFLLNLMGDD